MTSVAVIAEGCMSAANTPAHLSSLSALGNLRELALQIAEQFRAFGVNIGLRVAVIIGGMGMFFVVPVLCLVVLNLAGDVALDMTTQAVELSKSPHVVIATPGRFADHLKRY